MSVHVTSEIGTLRRVLVHTPGAELLGVTPGTREDFLYDDIIDLENARKEHKRFVAVLERFSDVLHVREALAEVLTKSEVRERLVARTFDVVPSEPLAQRLAKLPVKELVDIMIAGARDTPGPIAAALNEQAYVLPPLPNLFFTRDTGIVVGEHAIIGSMRYDARWTEELLISALFRFHPAFLNAGILYDGSEERRVGFHLEGGDIHPLRRDLVVLGFSERSSTAALDHIVDLLFAKCGIKDAIVVVLPKEPTAIHLDMIFTQVDRELCIISPPHFVGLERLSILRRHKDAARTALPADLHHYLEERVLPASWYPEQDLAALLRVMAPLLADVGGDPYEFMGRGSVREHMEGVYEHLLKGDRLSLARRVSALWQTQHDTGRLTLVSEGPGRARYELVGYGHPSREMCATICGYITEALVGSGFLAPRVEKRTCTLDGHGACVWECTWREHGAA